MSLQSMTGFARADGRIEAGRAWIWELKSVNGRGLELRFRLPSGFEAVEAEIRSQAQQKLGRGNITLNLNFLDDENAAPRYRLNEALLEQLLALAGRLEARGIGAPRLDGLLAVRGVVEPVADAADPASQVVLEAALKRSFVEALDRLVASRAAEGGKLKALLDSLLDEIETLVAQAAETAAARPDGLRRRLQQQLEDLLGINPPVAPERLAQELAMQITRLDVREELDRLRTHIQAARGLLDGKDAKGVGRKLDFLAQEFNREANTLCSKAFDPALTRIGLDLKLVVDRLREQAQNVE
ncbi:YicC/YloC family endoribonuclease [Ferrovibrio sp.]|uniref:YicC/YloC family endoribonuclease n=1 Tax=Ferrovibrio sp. TaxID=1917215 RepID=UPI0025C4B560|nr:YicC/YloC family endoribonuclease [Ferrovibrio sp.]